MKNGMYKLVAIVATLLLASFESPLFVHAYGGSVLDASFWRSIDEMEDRTTDEIEEAMAAQRQFFSTWMDEQMTMPDPFADSGKDEFQNGENMQVKESSAIRLVLHHRTSYRGAVNGDQKAQVASISLDKDSVWEVAGPSYVTDLTDEDKSLQNIHSNGHTVYYSSENEANSWLKGETKDLPGGGKLVPLQKKSSLPTEGVHKAKANQAVSTKGAAPEQKDNNGV